MVLDQEAMIELLFNIKERIEVTNSEGFEDLVERIDEIEDDYQFLSEEES